MEERASKEVQSEESKGTENSFSEATAGEGMPGVWGPSMMPFYTTLHSL